MVMSQSPSPDNEPQPAADLALNIDDDERNIMLAALDSHWRISEPGVVGGLLAPIRRFLVQQIVRPFVIPLLERQNAYNAALARALYALAESSDRHHSAYRPNLETTARHVAALEPRTDLTELRLGDLEPRTDLTELRITSLEPRTDLTELRLGDLEPRTDLTELRISGVEPRMDTAEGQIRELWAAIRRLEIDHGHHLLDLDDADSTLAELMLLKDRGSQPKVEPEA